MALSSRLDIDGMQMNLSPAVGEHGAVLARAVSWILRDVSALQFADSARPLVAGLDDVPRTAAAVLEALMQRQREVPFEYHTWLC